MRVFLEPDAAAELEDKVLDAQIEDDRSRFTIARRGRSVGAGLPDRPTTRAKATGLPEFH